MKTKQRPMKRQLYTLAEANAMLPLLRSILRDVIALQADLRSAMSGSSACKRPMAWTESIAMKCSK